MKVGIIRCRETENYCPGTMDIRFALTKQGKFAELEGETELIGFVSCGGCPGKQAVLRARELKKRGAEAIAFASCMGKGIPIEFKCPFFDEIKAAVRREVGDDIILLDYTH